MTQVMPLIQKQVMPDKPTKQRRMTVGQIVPLGFGIVLTVVGIATIVTEIAKVNLKETRELTAQGFEVQELLKQVEKDIVDAETGREHPNCAKIKVLALFAM